MELAAPPIGEGMALDGDGTRAGGPAGDDEDARPAVRTGRRLHRAHEAAEAALTAVSSYLDADEDLPAFFERVGHTIAEQVGARRAAFWRLAPAGFLAVQPEPFGFTQSSPVRELRIDIGSRDAGVMERAIFHDQLELGTTTTRELDTLWRRYGLNDIKSSVAVSWRAGERRIGALAAYDSRRGFTPGDLWVLRLAAQAMGLVWQYREAEAELALTASRLAEAEAARRRLLNNVAAGGDEARRRFASALHDDSLQLLTGAALQLERIRTEATGSPQAAELDKLGNTLRQVEDSLRGLLGNVSHEVLEARRDLRDAIRERLESMRLNAGIEPHIDIRLPQDLSEAVESIVLRNVSEALNNVEKHAHATRVVVLAEELDGGVRVQVTDDGAGFVVAESERMPGHLGLLAMRERAQLAGGRYRVVSEPGAGARVEFWVPRTL